MELLQQRIFELRTEKGITQKDLAKEIGVSMSAISFWESGINEPKASYVVKLSNFFGVSAEYILGMEDEFGTPTTALGVRAADSPRGVTSTSPNSLTEKENALIEAFRHLLPETQDFILRTAQSLYDDREKITTKRK